MPHPQYRGKRLVILPSLLGGSGWSPCPLFFSCNEILVVLYLWEPGKWDVGICQGYYGEEVRDVTLCSTNEIEEALRKLNECKSDTAMIKLALEFEYGYLLERLKGLRKARVEKIDISSVRIGSDTYAKKVATNERRYEYRDLPFCLCIEDGDGYRIIDGYHRYSTARKLNKRKIPIAILS